MPSGVDVLAAEAEHAPSEENALGADVWKRLRAIHLAGRGRDDIGLGEKGTSLALRWERTSGSLARASSPTPNSASRAAVNQKPLADNGGGPAATDPLQRSMPLQPMFAPNSPDTIELRPIRDPRNAHRHRAGPESAVAAAVAGAISAHADGPCAVQACARGRSVANWPLRHGASDEEWSSRWYAEMERCRASPGAGPPELLDSNPSTRRRLSRPPTCFGDVQSCAPVNTRSTAGHGHTCAT